MRDKQLGLGQYALHHLLDMDRVPRAGEARRLLEPRPSMAAGTEQQKIADTTQPLVDNTDRYLTDTGTNYDDMVQDTLDVDVAVEREQAEISDYSPTVGVASD
jgi:hypothetical protein